MRQQGSEYEFDPSADLGRCDRVNGLIAAHPDKFREAATDLDSYSAEEVRRRFESATPKERERFIGKPESFGGRFEEKLHDLSYHLAGNAPNPGWDWASEVLLVFWIACCEPAERGPKLTEFQQWKWEPEKGAGVSRNSFQLLIEGDFWRRVVQAVDKALAVAEARGLVAGLVKRAEADLGASDRKVLAAIRNASAKGTGQTAKDIGKAQGLSEDAVNRSVKKLNELGWTISNPRGSKGYRLEQEPAS